MSFVPAIFRCFECGAALGGHHWRVCAVCGRMFCRRHLIVATDTAMCTACHAADKGRAATGDEQRDGPLRKD